MLKCKISNRQHSLFPLHYQSRVYRVEIMSTVTSQQRKWHFPLKVLLSGDLVFIFVCFTRWRNKIYISSFSMKIQFLSFDCLSLSLSYLFVKYFSLICLLQVVFINWYQWDMIKIRINIFFLIDLVLLNEIFRCYINE